MENPPNIEDDQKLNKDDQKSKKNRSRDMDIDVDSSLMDPGPCIKMAVKDRESRPSLLGTQVGSQLPPPEIVVEFGLSLT